MQVVLVMFRGDGERRSFSVARDMTIIGRREDCDLRIPVGDVSRKHCRLIKDGETLKVEDLGSSNGTYVNNQRVQEAWLSAGDVVQVGPVQFVLQVDGIPADEDLDAASVGTAVAIGEPSLEEVTEEPQYIAPTAVEDELVLEEAPQLPEFVTDTVPEDEVVLDEVTLEELPAEIEPLTASALSSGGDATIDEPIPLPELEAIAVTDQDLVLEEADLEEAPVEEVELEEAEPLPAAVAPTEGEAVELEEIVLEEAHRQPAAVEAILPEKAEPQLVAVASEEGGEDELVEIVLEEAEPQPQPAAALVKGEEISLLEVEESDAPLALHELEEVVDLEVGSEDIEPAPVAAAPAPPPRAASEHPAMPEWDFSAEEEGEDDSADDDDFHIDLDAAKEKQPHR